MHYTINTNFSHLVAHETNGINEIDESTYLAWFSEVCEQTKAMIVHWQRVGFVHGVMNTDNMSILGLTIDYGPYGWLEDYNPDWTPNTTDAEFHRYAFGKQASIAHWNLMKLAQAISILFEDVQPLQKVLDDYAHQYQEAWQDMMRQKLGLTTFHQALVEQLLNKLEVLETDMTLFFRLLSSIKQEYSPQQCIQAISPSFYDDDWQNKADDVWLDWFDDYLKAIAGTSDAQRKENMDKVNPKYVLRNYLAQMAIDKAEQGDLSMLHELFAVLKDPYAEQPEKEAQFAQKRPEWARQRPGCSMLSCSS
jgi:uncharacterized protein YdiU (UPF0061 family)